METIRTTQKKYGSRAMAAAIVLALALIVIGDKAAGKGLVLGTLFSIFNFALMGQTIPKMMARGKRGATLISLGSLFLRFTLLAIPIIIAVKFDQFSLITTIIGIFAVQLAILWDQILIKTIKGTLT